MEQNLHPVLHEQAPCPAPPVTMAAVLRRVNTFSHLLINILIFPSDVIFPLSLFVLSACMLTLDRSKHLHKLESKKRTATRGKLQLGLLVVKYTWKDKKELQKMGLV